MAQYIEKSGTSIERSGTGIEKSGTGIEKSGTGIEKSGTGIGRIVVMLMAFTAMTLSGLVAADTRLAVSSKNGHMIVSVHGDDGVMLGASATPLDASGYARVPLYSVLQATGDTIAMGLLVQGSGSGSASEKAGPADASTLVQGSGSGDAKESVQPGGELMVQGSGSGNAGESAGAAGGRLLVQGSGSGSAGERCSGRSTLLVQGSGSGASGESAGCIDPAQAWGIAEVVVDRSGAHVIVHQIKESQTEEYLVAFLPVSSSEVAHSLIRGSSNHGFVATP